MTEWSNGDYRAAGMYEAQIAQYLDLAPNPYYSTFDADKRDPMAPAQFAAGWLYGISFQTEEHRDEIVNCFQTSDDLTNDLYDAMEAYENGD